MILIHVSEGNPLVWSVDEARQIRERFGLTGAPVGSLPRQPRQNTRLGLPLRLLPEEARLLVEEGAGVLVRTRRGVPGPQEREEEEEEEEQRQRLESSHSEQQALALEERRRALEGLAERIKHGRESKRRRHGEMGEPGVETGQGCPTTPRPLKELDELERSFTFPRANVLVQIHTACARPRSLEEVDWRSASEDWPYPGLQAHSIRYTVFKDLRGKGFHLTGGGKFGGDFLVYPGDPMRFHAHFIAICVPYSRSVPIQDTVTAGRLGSNVKKTVLLCSQSEDGTVVYTSVRWRGLQ